ncbi:tRNA epoxyqueuosine(34) reductase QueG [Paucibacter sp. DJ2R-2]|uniref:tRNA epoxyqueuosine(34) reductase QueG n=1 Tax=Paucibacter sp. DJ2R-2 TaxID=2893558 RepID=UPI0021E490A1|nr:tRNA epoxyqueuosine(34) reductase QueG [Paucibacter sp. DJ2R-2]MCV2420432.1 tRNA epoxyqueuosine(34) reductase QueG [Paucibacter sp. DJ4R-1]MCV2439610.1 tRNA epoxyqueuosine(34) reductase QueG [Paucibacter sp. DJ2R-2]
MADLQRWAHELGFSQIGVADIDLHSAEAGLLAWLQAGFHGSMHYMQSHGLKRARPAELVPGTLRVLSLRMDYLPQDSAPDWQTVEWQRLGDPQRAQVSLYARGRDYHKVLRARLQQLATRLGEAVGPFGYRVFTDSAPVLEVELAARSGIGWRGKHTLTLHRDVGSMFFLGEIYIDLPLPLSKPVTAHCGQCTACLDACPTGAIVAPYRVDARRCISYLTIEHEGAIPLELRPLIGNRLYGCDDCQLICPWNKFAQKSRLADFDARPAMAHGDLLAFWAWDEAQFLRQTEGSAMRRIGHARWQRNLAVVSGNALRHRDWPELRDLLQAMRPAASELLAEHLDWALAQVPAVPTPSAAPPATAAD